MSSLLWLAAASGWSVAVGVLLLFSARASRRDAEHALRLRATIEPYLLRRAQELGVQATGVAASVDSLDEVVTGLCLLSEKIAAGERAQFSETDRIAVAQTLPITRPPLDD